jgi:Fur family peroxide stress response transcriptional regulator
MNIRDTKQREAVLSVLRNTGSHPTANLIYDVKRKETSNLSKGTVYRNLRVLAENGRISVLNIKGTQSRYEVKRTNHYQFRCEKCD